MKTATYVDCDASCVIVTEERLDVAHPANRKEDQMAALGVEE